MERLLEDVAEHGWTPEQRDAFVRRYDRLIGETVLDLLVEYGLLGDRRALRSLRSYLESRLRDQRAGEEHPLWELVEETYMRVYTEIFQKELVQNYIGDVRAGTVQTGFEGYLRGVVRWRLLDLLGAGEKSEKELLDAIVDSKKPGTVRRHLADAKGRYGEKVRAHLLCAFGTSVEGHLQAVTDYFFERFLVEKYPSLRTTLEPGDSALLKTLEAFVAAHGRVPEEHVLRYQGQVTPQRLARFVKLTSTRTDSEPEGDEEALERAGARAKTKDPAQADRLEWWDRLLRCRKPTGIEVAALQRMASVLESNARRDTGLCLACVQLKTESAPEQQDDLRMFLIYYLSNYGAPGQANPENLTRDALCLEKIRGRELSWEQIFKIFGRECNPTRIKNRVREKFESLISGGRS
jgi:hypothetical protein